MRTTARGYDVLRNPAYDHCASQASDLSKHIYLWRLHDDNETLFYALLQAHLVEMLLVVDDPTVGEATRDFSKSYTRPWELFLSMDQVDDLPAVLTTLAVAGQADLSAPGAALRPANAALRTTSSVVAVDLIRRAQERGLATADIDNPVEAVRKAQWSPQFRPVIAI